MRLPLWMKIAWTVWVIVWVPVYWKQYGAQNFLYFCDMGNFLIAVALWTESALIFSWQATGLYCFRPFIPLTLLLRFSSTNICLAAPSTCSIPRSRCLSDC